MDMFRKIGPRAILIEYRGKLVGLVTVKDCLKYQFKVEASGAPREDRAGEAQGQERLWEFIRAGASWVSGRVERVSGGRIRLSGEGERREGRARREAMLDGTEEVEEHGVELSHIL
jgi:chloride channel 3/4/5